MARLRLVAAVLVFGCFLAAAPAAPALTLGDTTQPNGAADGSCNGAIYWQSASDPSYPYSIPAGGGTITSWSTNTGGDTAGTPVTMVVLQPSGTSVTVVGADSETLPNPLPAGGLATFNLAQPINVAAGDVLGMYSSSNWECAFVGSPIATTGVVSSAVAGAMPTSGTQYSAMLPTSQSILNLSVDLVQTQEVAMAAVAAPSTIFTGGAAEYAFTVLNSGPGNGAITFTDTVPAGLKLLSAAAGSGTCSAAGQTVTCTITGLPSGAAAPVLIIVSAATAGSYRDTAAVTTALSDPTPADNSATATLTVSAAPPKPSCHVIALAGAPLAMAKVAIPALDCKLGKIIKKASRTMNKGYLISTSPGAGKTLAAGTKVNIVVSSGQPRKTRKK